MLGGISISLNKQIYIYSVDTSAFYNTDEMVLHYRLNGLFIHKKKLSKKLDTYNKKFLKKVEKQEIKFNDIKWKKRIYNQISMTNKEINRTKKDLYAQFKKHKGIRKLNPKYFNSRNIISVFESSLTRIMNISEKTLSEDILIVQTYFFDVIEDIILDGFFYKNERYVCFTASAGQIRTKKTVFIKQSTLNKYYRSLTCGLRIKHINKHGGININKYLAYLALCNSATDPWNNFDITKTIVVEDMETLVNGEVDFIDDKTYSIERKKIDIPITHTDGCGMILPSKSKKNMMVRLPWIKGLLVSFPFDKFIREKTKENENYCGIIKDIYGKEHDILQEEIEVIFTKSQFKMWKYFPGWEKYIIDYQKYNCQAGKCNEEEDKFNKAKLNYQMLQTLIDITDEELYDLCSKTINTINNIGEDRKTMLKVLGVVDSNANKNYIQQALSIYPELLNDTYCKEIIKQVKKSVVKDAKAGKIDVDGIYTFISPDLYAFCEYLFLGDKNPKGLLEDKKVYCKLYKNVKKLDCLRSPHLYREHAIRENDIDKEKSKWFTTDALYTSCHDIISKILMFDVDGDKGLVCAERTLVNVAERNMDGIVPLYYNMAKAGARRVDNKTIYEGLKTAYTGGNIGMISNDITKIWNSDNVNLDVIKILCMESNFTIDYAKTLYKPERPSCMKKIITSYTRAKTPHFFIYAKDKTIEKVEKANNSVVNRLGRMIPNSKINFRAANLGKFKYTMLMNNSEIDLDDKIINKYKELDLKKKFMISKSEDGEKSNIEYVYENIRKQLLELNNDEVYVTDVLIKHLYKYKKSNYKTTLWECFGYVIVENLKKNIAKGSILCDRCGKRIEEVNNKVKYCKECAKKVKRENDRRIQKERYNSRK